MDDKLIMGIDIGGSHITSALVNMESRTIVPGSYQRKHIDCKANAEQIITDWSTSVNSSFAYRNLKKTLFGVAMPGPFDYDKGISLMKDNDKYEALYGLDIKIHLATKLHVLPTQICFSNDAVCFLKGEVLAGSAKGYQRASGITLGTGLGSAKCHNGAGEDANFWCMPFRQGVAEDYLSTRWFVNRYAELSAKAVKNVKEIAELYHVDSIAKKVFDEFSEALTEILAQIVYLDSPDIIVVGGNISRAANRFLPNVKKLLKKQLINIPIVTATLGEDAAILGAASLVF